MRVFRQRIGQPLLRQQDLRAIVEPWYFLIFLAVDQRHRRVQSHQRYTAVGERLELIAVADRRPGEGAEKTLHVQRFAVGAIGRQKHPITQLMRQLDKARQQRRFEVTGEGVLHQHHAALTLCHGQFAQGWHAGDRDLATGQRGLQVMTVDQRAVEHADLSLKQAAHPFRAHHRVVKTRRVSHVGNGELQRADQVVTQRSLIATVVQLQKTRTEFRDVDLDRALSRAGFTGQAARHRVIDFMGKIRLAPRARQVIA
ncbi:hypothetical protein D3C87_776840 [compost metagenome]